MNENRIKLEVECDVCGGTGLYSGMAERDECAVVCSYCKGTGKATISYNEFTGRKKKNGIKRVFARSCGFVHSHKDIVVNGKEIKFSEGGCTYNEWLNGAKPKPVKDLYCPYMWDNKGIDKEPLDNCKDVGLGGSISDCKHFNNKHICWKRYKGEK